MEITSVARKPHRGVHGPRPASWNNLTRNMLFHAPIAGGEAGSVIDAYRDNRYLGPLLASILPGSWTAPRPVNELNDLGTGIRIANDATILGDPATVEWNLGVFGRNSLPLAGATEFTIAFTIKIYSKALDFNVALVQLWDGSSVIAAVNFVQTTTSFDLNIEGVTDDFASVVAPTTLSVYDRMIPLVFTWHQGEGAHFYFDGNLQDFSASTSAVTITADPTHVVLSNIEGIFQRHGSNANYGSLIICGNAWTESEALHWSRNPWGFEQMQNFEVREALEQTTPPPAVPSEGSVSTPSETSIANAALLILEERKINSLDDSTKTARLIRSRFAEVRDELARSVPWNFALARASLSEDDEKPLFGYVSQYQMPEDLLRLVEVDGPDHLKHTVNGRKILADHLPPLEIVYVKRVTDPMQMDTLFRKTLAALLALDLAEAITGSRSSFWMAYDVFQRSWLDAATANGQEKPSQEDRDPGAFVKNRSLKFFRERERELNATR